MKQHTLAVITGTRAEYGLLRPVLQKLQADPRFDLRLLVTGAHLAAEYGSTVEEIEGDGMPIAARIPILKFGQGPLATAQTVAYTIQQFSTWFWEHKPKAVLVLGDRYEIFAAAQAAAMTGIPIAHISGGDVTLGAADDYYRHCITKMAHLHFPSCQEYAQRLVRMGEQPGRVWNVGGLGDENIRTMEKLTRSQLSESVGMDLSGPFGLVTFHPETAGDADPLCQVDQLLLALDAIGSRQPIRWLVTKSNADAGGLAINQRLDDWAAQRQGQVLTVTSLGVKRYLSAMQYASVVVGNSSSGVVETPTFGVPAVNIGQRQAGRILCANVVCCPAQSQAIQKALEQALSPEFEAQARRTQSPYNGGNTSQRMVQILADWLDEPDYNAPKVFYDGPFCTAKEETL